MQDPAKSAACPEPMFNSLTSTHEVTSQPTALAGFNLFESEMALQETARREGVAWADRPGTS